jgi:hypothetical protein
LAAKNRLFEIGLKPLCDNKLLRYKQADFLSQRYTGFPPPFFIRLKKPPKTPLQYGGKYGIFGGAKEHHT